MVIDATRDSVIDEYFGPEWTMRTSYPGQAVAVVPLELRFYQHYMTKGWKLPFIELLCDGEPPSEEALQVERVAYRLTFDP